MVNKFSLTRIRTHMCPLTLAQEFQYVKTIATGRSKTSRNPAEDKRQVRRRAEAYHSF